MTTQEKVIRTKVGLLELAKQLQNVSQACRLLGYSRESFCRFKEPHQGRWCYDKTPMAAFEDSVPLAKEKTLRG